MGKLTSITFAVIWFVLGCLITYKAYYIVPIIYEQMPITLLKVLFYIGLIIMWLSMILVVPLYTIINEFKEEAQI